MSNPELDEWLVMRCVTGGGVAKVAGVYFDHGRPVHGHLTPALDQLMWSGLVAVADGDPLWDLRRISLSDAGQARYLVLCQQQGQRTELEVPTPLEVPAPEFGCDRTSAQNSGGDRASDSRRAAPGDWQEPSA